MKLILSSIFVVMGSSPFVFANWEDYVSVWDQSSARQFSIEGVVKTIATEEESDRIIVKVKKANDEVEVVQVCNENIQSATQQLAYNNVHLTLLQNAMAQGQKVILNYASSYDRCIKTINVVQKAGQPKTAKSPTQSTEI
ncbi:MAG: hypothetical protein KDD34_03555 [Bdellovibrionales bacterium]|nr:hypothetical protein [Bdellovibrionales bacterium]